MSSSIPLHQVIIPPWLHDIFLGYGDPGAAHYTGMDAAQV